MDNALIQKHNFEVAKKNIERFSRNLPSNPSFNQVEVNGGLFGLGDHKVTGSEMNNFIGVVQNKLISVNSSLKNIISEFKEVYNAFDVLDEEYITGIIGAVESAEEASKQALNAQEDIKATVENLRKTVVGLVNLKMTVERIEETVNASNITSYKEIANKLDNDYKIKHISSLVDFCLRFDTSIEKMNQIMQQLNNDITALQQYRSILESYNHLGEVDKIWSDVEEHKTDLGALHLQVDNFIEKVDWTTQRIDHDITALQQYRSILESYNHLGEVDKIWSDVEEHKTDLGALHLQVDNFIEKVNQTTQRIDHDITSLQQYRSILESYKHLGDVDKIWSDVEEHKTDLGTLHQQIDTFISEVHITEAEIKELIQKVIESNTSEHLLIRKRIKIAYGIGGFAASLSVIQLILQLFGVL